MLTFTGIFDQVPIDSKLVIPPQKPEMEYILDTKVNVIINKDEVIDTPLLVPEAEDEVQLRKVVVSGIVEIKIVYSALVPDQKVHAAHFNVPFCELIEWPDGPPQGTPIEVDPVIEKEVFMKEDERRIFKSLLIRLDIYR
ncbi:DUF3794 domain-containing protein [Acetohalobium arabaticum]|uniref:SipL SPOCS domain-containing protein n=1 Tax=Acetohalobium arabaticum (strain ATCC 49924 / DSM 5501 / Z-7288) TaxID=574087 RepID=D9QR78_ACEAZ|nr:DUF3794 domain-containing protein [Acetohalobium arabaticum]ADL13019.1 hypothetical protein Acear_1512 [Acetohalobium arabaticum DSM 5501]